MSNPTIGFIGYGNMAQAIAEGLVAAGAIDGTDIVACAAHYDKLEKDHDESGCHSHCTTRPKSSARVRHGRHRHQTVPDRKRHQASRRRARRRRAHSSYPLRQAGISTNTENLFGADFNAAHIQCTIPNTPMAVGKGVLVTEADNTLTDTQAEDVRAAVLIDQPHRTR